ncbi:MAG: helix-turn-helix transcriptional regulator [Desulfovibrio sp.]|jgi:AraC-like DNA-binding protein|nr:helix-turn-helix transcriptional regulator [Desulfovibrio sp.]
MPQKDRDFPLTLSLEEAVAADGGEMPEVVRVRPDIGLCIFRGGRARLSRLWLEAADSVLVLRFDLPQNGGEGALPEGRFSVRPTGRHLLADPPLRGLLLCITESRLLAILAEDAGTLPGAVRAALAARERAGESSGDIALAPDQILAGNALMCCPHEGAVRNMFIKSKALELIALFFLQLAGRRRGEGRLSPGDRAFVAAAREYFFARMDSLPTIRQMARHAGTSETKLKRLFKEVYGLSLHAHLRRERMAAAWGMLLHQGANVSEAALAVGYNNVSHFIRAFSRQYGIRPGSLRFRR